MQADTIVGDLIDGDGRHPVDIVDLAAEAMWREAVGKDCLERRDQFLNTKSRAGGTMSP